LAVIASFSIRYICLFPHRCFLLSFLHVEWVCGCEFLFCFLLSLPLRKSLGSGFLLSFSYIYIAGASSALLHLCHTFTRAWDTWWELSSVIFFRLVVLIVLETLQELGISGTSFHLFIYVLTQSASFPCFLQLQTLLDLPELRPHQVRLPSPPPPPPPPPTCHLVRPNSNLLLTPGKNRS
jgi:hypothetical protein